MRVCRSPELFAAYRGLHRLYVPRHPPHTFVRLTLSQRSSKARAISNECCVSYRKAPTEVGTIGTSIASLRFFVLAADRQPEG